MIAPVFIIMWFEKMKKPILALAPMADYTDSPFCNICRQVSDKNFVIYREMVSSEAIIRNSKKTLQMCEFSKIERPIIIQVFGSHPTTMSKAVGIIQKKYKPDGIDINMGCPVPKITKKNKAGAALMKDHDTAVAIIKQIKTDNPEVVLSVKTRLGWSDDNEILEFAPKLEKAGVQFLTIHGRTKKVGYSGVANWEMIKKVKDIINIPVIANGDVRTMDDILRCLKITRADGIMIGRGALGNPWIFSSKQPDLQERIDVILRHANLHVKHYGEKSVVTFRKHLLLYFKQDKITEKINFSVKELRKKLVAVSSVDELKDIIYPIL